MSGWGVAAQAGLAALLVITRADIIGVAVFIPIFSAIAVLSNKLLATAAPFFLTTLLLIQSQHTTAYERFRPLFWVLALPILAMLLHLVIYPPRKLIFPPFFRGGKPSQTVGGGRAFWPMLAVSIVIVLGGVGYISAEEYFALTSFAIMLALGFGMLIAYLWLRCAMEESDSDELPRYLTNVMLAIGLLGAFMVFHHYAAWLLAVPGRSFRLLAFQWRNNVSTFLMMALPFAFYKALRQPAWLAAAAAMFAAMLLSGSRGGLVFGAVTLLLCMIYLLVFDKRRRKIYLGALGVLLVAFVVSLRWLLPFFTPVIDRLLDTIRYSDDEIRVALYRRGVEDFLRRPIFGTGLGYMGNRDVHVSAPGALCWYHNSIIQIIGSFGAMGILAYGWLYFNRAKIFLQRRSPFHVTLLLSWISVELMSLVNPGVFVPIPYLLLVIIFMVVSEKSTRCSFFEPLRGASRFAEPS
ncbi:MAG: O-antigen ligase family protein [Oscillospiraceae bacterium]|nr:O-antigen ligase family protein [Oscillospiraceae bacterium]